jgi:lysophospholipase L1-like esterase
LQLRSALAVLAAALIAALPTAPVQAQADRWEKEVAAFEASDRIAPPPKGEIVFVGSSTIHHWDTTTSFPDLKIINRGIWVNGQGFELADALRYSDRIVIPYQPRIVVVYAGDNDISGGKTSEQVVVDAEKLINRLRAKLPDVRIVFIGLKPSPARWLQVDRMRTTNAMLRQLCERDDRVAYMDVDGPMMGWDEKPRRELFVEDGLHLSPEGYRLWSVLLRPLLIPPAPPTTTIAVTNTSARP